MTNSIYICTAAIEKTLDTGITKKVKEKYLVCAVSPSDAEAILCQEITPFASGEFEVKSISKDNVSEIFLGDGDRWFRACINFISIDEKSGAEKKSKSNMYIRSSDFMSANNNLMQAMKGTISDYEIFSLTETPIFDIFNYNESN